MALLRVPSFPSPLPSSVFSKKLSSGSSFSICCSSQYASNDVDKPKEPRRLSEQSSWEAKDSEGRDYLYRLGKKADNMNIAVGARAGVIDNLFDGNFLGKDSDVVFDYRQKDKVVCHITKNYLAHLLNVSYLSHMVKKMKKRNKKKGSSDFDFANEIYLLEVLDGKEEGNLQQLDAKFAEQLHFQDALYESTQVLLSSKPKSRGKSQSLPKPSKSATKPKTGESSQSQVLLSSKPKSRRISQSLPKPSKSATKPKTGESSQSYCLICFRRKERPVMFPIPGCSHSFCSECINKYVETRLKENVTIITCPGENCRVVLELEPSRPVLSNQVINRWQDLLCEETLCATGGRLYCPFKECSALLLNDNRQEVITESECPYCHKLFCAQCRVPWHFGIGCEEYQKLGEDERGREDILVRNLAKEKKWRRCPRCHIIVERTEGCPHMTCRCKLEFCYACGKEWTTDHGSCQGN